VPLAEECVADAVLVSRGVAVLETTDSGSATRSTDSSSGTGRLAIRFADALIVTAGACSAELVVSFLGFIPASADGAGFASANADSETAGGSEAGVVPPGDAAAEMETLCANASAGGLLRAMLLVSAGSAAAIFVLLAESACGAAETDAADGFSGETVDVGVCGRF
jgi:hypothetical protein